MNFEQHWKGALQAIGLEMTPAVSLERIIAEYRTPSRFYHNLEHVEACLRIADEFGHHDPRITLAFCYHDVVYDTRSSDNERQSADWALLDLRQLGAKPADTDAVARLILATAHRTPPARDDEQIVVDADLSILGGLPSEYDQYARGIRLEYAWVSEPEYRLGRGKFLRSLLSRESIYSTALLKSRLEDRARANLLREFGDLQAGATAAD